VACSPTVIVFASPLRSTARSATATTDTTSLADAHTESVAPFTDTEPLIATGLAEAPGSNPGPTATSITSGDNDSPAASTASFRPRPAGRPWVHVTTSTTSAAPRST
jgi:hypothetical protein